MVHIILKTLLEISLICGVIVTLISIPGSMAQIRTSSVCGRVVRIPDGVARTDALLYFGPGGFDDLLPGAVTEPNGAFCIENNVRDLTERTSARLYVTSICRSDDVTLVNVPFWPELRREGRFLGKPIVVGPGRLTNVGNVDFPIVYGHVSLRILNRQRRPLLTDSGDWFPLWIRVRDQHGVVVHESGLSPADVERSVDLKESRINLALPEGRWRLEVALSGVPPATGGPRRKVIWKHVPVTVRIESCRKDTEVNLLLTRPIGERTSAKNAAAH